MDIYLDTRRGLGLGDMLCLISLLSNIPEKVILYSNNRENYFDKISHLVKLLKSPIKVVETDAEGDFYGAYHLKTVCDYFYADRILRDTSPKNYIGLVLYNSTDAFVDKDYNFIRNDDRARPVSEGNALRYDIPQRKFRSLEYYSKFFELARRCGYDVITLDAHEKLDQKVEFLLKNCAAVIGYEGGIAHLCHMLRIPYIMLDHQQPNTNPYGVFQCDMMHQAKTVHILRDEEKFLQLERWQLSNLIGDLKKGKTNNWILTGEINISFVKGVINSPIRFYNKDKTQIFFESTSGPQLSDSAIDLIHKYFTIPTV